MTARKQSHPDVVLLPRCTIGEALQRSRALQSQMDLEYWWGPVKLTRSNE